eukprot:scaffold754_cov248-Pinguiococcus_pyrenoidosus.AAC.34
MAFAAAFAAAARATALSSRKVPPQLELNRARASKRYMLLLLLLLLLPPRASTAFFSASSSSSSASVLSGVFSPSARRPKPCCPSPESL